MNAVAADLPRFAPVDAPELDAPAGPGIRIAAPGLAAADAPFVVSGRFVIPEDEHRGRGGTPHRDLVLTVLRDPLYAACHPFNGCIFFRDDVRVEAGLAQGWFTLDVWAYCGFRTPGKYFLRVSLGHTLSDYVETVVS